MADREAENLAGGRQHPEAQFTLMQIPTGTDDADEYHLGTSELPDVSSKS